MTLYVQSNGGEETGMGPRYGRGLYLGTNYSSSTISSVTIKLKKKDNPTGDASLLLINGSGTTIGSLGTIDLDADLDTDFEDVTFNDESQDTDTSNCALILARDDDADMGDTVYMEWTDNPSPATANVTLASVEEKGNTPTQDTVAFPRCWFTYSGVTPPSSSGTRLPPPPLVLRL